MKSKPDGGKFGRFKAGSTRARNVTAHIHTAASFGLKTRIEIV